RYIRATRKLRGFDACIRATQASKSEAAIFWRSLLAKQQKQYDNPNTRLRIMKKLCCVSNLVRSALSAQGHDQSELERGKGALSVEGVIYVLLYDPRGQSIHSAFERFKQHVWQTAKTRFAGTPFHRRLFRYALSQAVIFPLEKIPTVLYETGVKGRTERFRAIATPREQYWIHRLITQLPFGLNVVPKLRRRHRRQPLMWRRLLAQAHPNELTENGTTVSAVANSATSVGESSQTVRRQARRRTTTKVAAEVYHAGTARTFAYRDFSRRCRFLARCFEDGRLGNIDWASYRRANLWRMLHALQYRRVTEVTEKARKAIVAQLRSVLAVREGKKREQKEVGTVIKIDWTAHSLKAVALKRIVSEQQAIHLLPVSIRKCFERVVVARKLVKPIAPLIFNFAKVAKTLPALPEPDGKCVCRTLFPERFRPSGGCVLTGDVSLVRNDALRALLQYGPRFRLTVRMDPMSALRDAIDNLIDRLSDCHAIAKVQFTGWREYVLERCKVALSHNCHHSRPQRK
ncbi:MAG TPA: hypothetical protein V6C97_02010, partial [Oculatellaceae cyanobacterium]